MSFRAVYHPLGGCHDGNGILLGKTLHHLPGCPRLFKSQAGRVLRAEENIHIGKDPLNAGLCLLPGPKIAPEIHVKGHQCACILKPFDHLNGGLPDLLIESQGNACGVETPAGAVDLLWYLVNVQRIEGAVAAVIDHLWLSGISTVLVKVDPHPGLGRVIVQKIVVADAVGTDLALHKTSHVVGRQLGDHPGVQPQKRHAHSHIQLRTAYLLLKGIAPHQPLIARRGETQKKLSQCQQIKCPFFSHGLPLFLRSFLHFAAF